MSLAFQLAGRSGKESIPRVAILAFDDFSHGQNHRPLALATTEALVARLSREPGLDVVSRASAMSLGEELGYLAPRRLSKRTTWSREASSAQASSAR